MPHSLSIENINPIIKHLSDGEVIAYPTEAVFGLGCDPDNIEALKKLLAIKQRPIEKGLILVAANYQQLQPYVDESELSQEQLDRALASWPGAVTWIFPAKKNLSPYLTGEFQSIAVRVTKHPLVRQLCESFGKPITSTSANLTGFEPCKTLKDTLSHFNSKNIPVLAGETLGGYAPSEIRDIQTNLVIRKG